MNEISRRRILQSGAALIAGAALAKVEMADAWTRAATRNKILAQLRARLAPTPVATPTPAPAPVVAPAPLAPTLAVPLVRSTWVPFLNTAFIMKGPAGGATVTLVQINDLQPVRLANDQNRFSLLFRGPAGERLPQGIYSFKAGSVSTALFAVPVEQVTTSGLYEAVINRA